MKYAANRGGQWEGAMGLLYEEGDDTPTKIGNTVGSILAICVFIGMAWLATFPLWH